MLERGQGRATTAHSGQGWADVWYRDHFGWEYKGKHKDHLAEPAHLDTLRKLFVEPERLKPGQSAESVTRQAAERFGLLADGMRVRGVDAHDAAHFLMKLMFCMSAEDIGLLGTPEKLFKKILVNSRDNPARLADHLRVVIPFEAKSNRNRKF